MILEHAVTWFGQKFKMKLIPSVREKEDYDVLFRQAVLYLFSGVHSAEYSSVMAYTASIGAVDMLDYILNIQG